MEYHLHQNGEQVGPYTHEQITAMLSSGQISPEDMIWHDGLPEWKPIREVIQANAGAAPQTPSLTPSPNPGMAAAPASSGDSQSLFRKIRLASLLGAIALFFLPWVDVQCSGTSIATQTGIQTITGASSPSDQMKSMGEDMGADSGMSMEMNQDSNESMGKGPMIAVALALIVVAAILSFVALSGGGAAEKYAGILSTVALGLLAIQLVIGFPAKREMIKSMKEETAKSQGAGGADPMGGAMEDAMTEAVMTNFKIKAKPAFYFELVAVGIPVFLMFVSRKED